jgi:hypothetical protein
MIMMFPQVLILLQFDRAETPEWRGAETQEWR